MRRIVVSGATGTIGSALCRALLERGDQPVALTRAGARAQVRLPTEVDIAVWSAPETTPPPAGTLNGSYAVVNLLGEPIAQRWTRTTRTRIHDSRTRATEMLVAAARRLPANKRPQIMVSQSATGYYGHADGRELTEDAPAGSDFLAEVVQAWEAAARQAEDFSRVALTRTGVVLSGEGGALKQMLPFFRAGIGGPVAGGKQFVPWVHIDDVVAALLFCIDTPQARGPLNLTAPTPVDNATFSHALGRALRRPTVLPVPAAALRLLYGRMSEVVTTGQRAVPRQLLALGYEFTHTDLDGALRDALTRRAAASR